jgi:hypothetical protein
MRKPVNMSPPTTIETQLPVVTSCSNSTRPLVTAFYLKRVTSHTASALGQPITMAWAPAEQALARCTDDQTSLPAQQKVLVFNSSSKALQIVKLFRG